MYWPPDAAGYYANRSNTLQTIATVYVGEFVRVVFQWERWCSGSAYYNFGWEITLNPGASADHLGHVFFHEIAHLVLGHVQCKNIVVGVDPEAEHPLTMLRHQLEANPKDDAAAAFLPYVEKIEREADIWADQALAEFEAQWGPFLDVLSGKVKE